MEKRLRALEIFDELKKEQKRNESLSDNLRFKISRYLACNQSIENMDDTTESIQNFKYQLWIDHGLSNDN